MPFININKSYNNSNKSFNNINKCSFCPLWPSLKSILTSSESLLGY